MSMTSETQLASKLLALAKIIVQSASIMDFDEDEEENEKMSSEESDDGEDETSGEEEETEEEREERFRELAEESTGLESVSPRKSSGSSMKSRWDVFKKEEELSPSKEETVGLSPEMSKLIDGMFSSHVHKNEAARLIKKYKPKNLKQAKEILEFSKETILKKKLSKKFDKKFTPETDVQRIHVKREFKGPSSGGSESSEVGFRPESWESAQDLNARESLANRINSLFDTSFALEHMELLGEGDFDDIKKLLDAADLISSRDMSTSKLLGFLNALLELEHKKEEFSEQTVEETELGKPKKKEYKSVKVSLPKSVMKTIKEESGKAIETLQKKTKNRIFNTELFDSLRDFVNSVNKAIAASDMSSLFSLMHISSSERASYDADSLMDLLHTKLSSDFKKATGDYIKQMFKRKVAEIKEQPKPRKILSNAEAVARLLLASRLI